MVGLNIGVTGENRPHHNLFLAVIKPKAAQFSAKQGENVFGEINLKEM